MTTAGPLRPGVDPEHSAVGGDGDDLAVFAQDQRLAGRRRGDLRLPVLVGLLHGHGRHQRAGHSQLPPHGHDGLPDGHRRLEEGAVLIVDPLGHQAAAGGLDVVLRQAVVGDPELPALHQGEADQVAGAFDGGFGHVVQRRLGVRWR